MKNSGVTDLPLHGGKAPWWLLSRMKGLAKEIVSVIVDEYGQKELVRRISDPYWFQALSCALAFDWHSSGTTTVLCGVLKSVMDPQEHGVGVAGGKGRHAADAPGDIASLCGSFGLSSAKTDSLLHCSRIAGKVDSAALQDGYDIYHHCMVLDEKGNWTVVQQGLNTERRYARRYQWTDNAESLTISPHSGITGTRERDVLDLTAQKSADTQKAITDLVKEDPTKVRRMFVDTRKPGQTGLESWMDVSGQGATDMIVLPEKVNWGAIRAAYEWQPSNFEEVLEIRGMGAKTLRGLSLVSELVYGSSPSWEDPVRYSFAYGGKDGVPYPVEREAMDESIRFLKDAVSASKGGDKEKIDAFRRLESYASRIKSRNTTL